MAASPGRLAYAVPCSHRRDGVHRGVLDSALPDLRSGRTEVLLGYLDSQKQSRNGLLATEFLRDPLGNSPFLSSALAKMDDRVHRNFVPRLLRPIRPVDHYKLDLGICSEAEVYANVAGA